MQSWAEHTAGCVASGIKMVADGNGEYIKALGLNADFSEYRMGIRSKRFAMIVEYGKIVSLVIDEDDLDKSSAESVLALLGPDKLDLAQYYKYH